ncbi:phosphatidylcholine/phosphatidylserine synthase [Bartonella sp. DGB1]|uniref:CDP-alcohol phosphatidyltransferase family protein n=1 Tax=Bartonella sp. DGB1 TaxID=3239807 RepID=UPI003523215F
MSKKKLSCREIKAFSVHILTALGSVAAFFSIVFACNEQWYSMFVWMAISLIIDGIDGPIARKFQVKEILPNWSGELLDNIIDYVTYVFIPAFVFYKSGLMTPILSYLSAIIIVFSSAIYYANTGMKTSHNFFKGFPVVWNLVLFVLFLTKPSSTTIFLTIFLCAFSSFLPIWFLHPVRVKPLRIINLPIFLIWAILCIMGLVIYDLNPPALFKIILVTLSFYLLMIGAIMQLLNKKTEME